MWKNLILVRRRKLATTFEILVPVIFAVLLVIIRGIQMPIVYETAHEYTPLQPIISDPWAWSENRPLDYNLAYAPSHPALEPLMALVKESLGITDTLRVFATPEEMNQMLISDQSRKMLAGIIFEGLEPSATTLPNDLHSVIRFPAESRAVATLNALTNNWQTDSLFPFFSTGGPRNPFNDNGGNPPGYYEERFMAIQSAISQAFIEMRSEAQQENLVLRAMRLIRFSDPPRTIDTLLFILQLFLPLVMFLGFLYPAINSVKVSK